MTVTTALDATALEHFATAGWLRSGTIAASGVETVAAWVDEVASWPDGGPWLHHRELTDHGPKLCRSENFVPHHAGLRALLTAGPVLEIASALLGEPALLYKEKINYKLAGGAGYSPHQDAPAYPFVDLHVSCMVAVDDATTENGCLEVVSAAHGEVLPMGERGCIRSDVVESMTWEPVELRAGELLWFHSRTPHRSGPNRSSRDRRAIYPTYNAASEGDLRECYYAEQRAALAAARSSDRVALSLIGDFEGRPVT